MTQVSPPKAPAKAAATEVKPASKETKVSTKAVAPAVTTGASTYKVEKGDNPYKIAKKLGVGYQELLKVNSIDDPTKLQIGQILKVPGKTN